MATAETTVNFGDLKDDKQIQEKIITLRKSVEKIENMLDVIASNPDLKEKLTLKEKVDYDLFMAYTLNTLFWMYMRMKGEDPNKNEVKNQLNRVKDYMIKAKQAHERNTIRPTIKKDVAGRFIKHGINHSNRDEPKPKKIKTKP